MLAHLLSHLTIATHLSAAQLELFLLSLLHISVAVLDHRIDCLNNINKLGGGKCQQEHSLKALDIEVEIMSSNSGPICAINLSALRDKTMEAMAGFKLSAI